MQGVPGVAALPPGGMPAGDEAGLPPEAAMMGAQMPSESDMLRMMFDQVVGGLESQQAQIAGVEQLLMQALMEAASATAPPAPEMMMPMEGSPMGAGPGPVGPPPVGGPATEADLLAGLV